MRIYDFTRAYEQLLTPDIVALLTQIHEYKGEQALFIEAKADTLTKLVEIAKIQSTEASNKIEGISTSDERLKKLVQDKTAPRTRNEQEIAGYGHECSRGLRPSRRNVSPEETRGECRSREEAQRPSAAGEDGKACAGAAGR